MIRNRIVKQDQKLGFRRYSHVECIEKERGVSPHELLHEFQVGGGVEIDRRM